MGGPCAVPMAGGRYRVYYSGRRRSAVVEAAGSGAGSGNGSEGGRAWEGFGLALTPAEATREEQLFDGMRTDLQRLVPKQME